MIVAPKLVLGLAFLAAAGCSTDPGNSYGSGGTTGTIQVHDSIVGSKGDTTAFTVSVGTQSKPVAQAGVVAFTGLAPNAYVVTVGSLGRCTVEGGNGRDVQVFAGYIQYLTLVTDCS